MTASKLVASLTANLGLRVSEENGRIDLAPYRVGGVSEGGANAKSRDLGTSHKIWTLNLSQKLWRAIRFPYPTSRSLIWHN